ncbi:MAG TPA: hypothetical protein VEJ47_08225 [Candidatus Eremiobacteraceae bacterium]|nr:hypothetical protein [Candidatus Eremiobacteraceae bacterium]
MSTATEAISEINANGEPLDIDALFRANYPRVARIVARVVRDQAHANGNPIQPCFDVGGAQLGMTPKPQEHLHGQFLGARLVEVRVICCLCRGE